MALLLTTTTPPGILTKTSWYVTMKMSTLKFKGQVGATIYPSHDNTNDKNTVIKSQHTQTKQSERRESRWQTHNNESLNEYSNVQSIATDHAKRK